MKSLIICTLFVGLVCMVLGADTENARLLASKTLLNQFIVEDKDLTVQYDIYNIGGRSAKLLKLYLNLHFYINCT